MNQAASAPPMPVDLDAYFRRVGYAGPRTPTLDTLRALHALHPAAIVFEAIDVLLGRRIDLSPAAVDAKLIHAGRGGYCFEHNNLFKRVLVALGFQVEGLAARVLWNRPVDAPPLPSTHMALRVTAGGQSWLADVGFGGCVLTAPLRIDLPDEQLTSHEVFRLAPRGDALLLQARLDGQWVPLYELAAETQLDVDYEPRNWYTSTHPDSHFRRNLMVARTTPAARHTLLRNRYTLRRPDGSVQRQTLDADGIARALVEVFGLPVEPQWRGLFEQAVVES